MTMTDFPTNPSTPDAPVELDGAAVQRMLELGVDESRRPVDVIIERVAAKDGAAWIRQTLLRSPVGGLGDPEQSLVSGQSDLEQLRRAAERCRTDDAPPGSDAALGAMLAYFLTIAAALAHHGAKLSRRSRTQIDESLLDLAAAAPEPWRDLLCRAVDAPTREADA